MHPLSCMQMDASSDLSGRKGSASDFLVGHATCSRQGERRVESGGSHGTRPATRLLKGIACRRTDFELKSELKNETKIAMHSHSNPSPSRLPRGDRHERMLHAIRAVFSSSEALDLPFIWATGLSFVRGGGLQHG